MCKSLPATAFFGLSLVRCLRYIPPMPTPKTPASKKTAAAHAVAEAHHAQPAPAPTLPTGADPAALDEASGAAALLRLTPRLRLTPARPGPIRFNVRLAAGGALGLHQLVRERGLRPGLAQLASIGQFELATLDSLPDLGRALWYVRHQLDAQAALSSEAKLPAKLVEEASELRERMMQVLAFRVGSLPAAKARLDYIRRGSGYQDLADDLVQLGALYQEHQPLLKALPEPYDGKDLGRAAQLATQILLDLGLKPTLDKTGKAVPAAQADLSTLQQQLAALLEEAHDEVATACAFLTRKDPALCAQFRPLTVIARTRPRPATQHDDEPTVDPGTPAVAAKKPDPKP